ncbi:MAG: aspartyl/glutamyl-tRNA amidotransferase subunit A [Clostridia bacterium]|nr:aspartyl/glutamyl-tRNA amidotransferase subunit A [Clostridia bacterium]
MGHDIVSLTIAELQKGLADRAFSAAEAAEAYLGRMEEKEPVVNAYLTKTPALAREQAARADELLKNGEHAPLLGVPYALKDNLAVRGVRLSCASAMLADFVPAYDAAVYEKLCGAGGVLLGKTNLDEFAMGSSTERSIAGPTRNPLDPSRSAGGSSGGSAAAVAAGEAAFALGSDTGGSARQPAAFCGLVAMKPTYGLVSRRGMIELASSLDCVCPITRTVTDCAAVLNVLAGQDPGDMTTFPSGEDYLSGLESGVRGMRFGIVGEDMLDGCADAVKSAVRRAASLLEKLGAQIEQVRLPLEMALEVYLVVASAEASSNLARFDGIRYGLAGEGDSALQIMKSSRTKGLGDEVKRRIVTGAYALSSTWGGGYYRKIKTAQQTLCRETDEILAGVDTVLLPTAAGAAFPLGSWAENPTAQYVSDRFTTIANLTGSPAIQFPGGGDGEMPVGLTLMGRKRSESVLLRAAFALEAELSETVRKEAGRYERI